MRSLLLFLLAFLLGPALAWSAPSAHEILAASDAIRKMDHCIVKYEYNLTANTFKIYEANYCDAANTSLAVKHYPQPETVKVAPESKEEKFFDTISKYATAHSDKLTTRAMN